MTMPPIPAAMTPAAVAAGNARPGLTGYEPADVERAIGWIDEARSMFVDAGLHEAGALAPARVDVAPGMPVAEMRPESGLLLLGQEQQSGARATRSRDLVTHEYTHYVLARTLLPHRLASADAATMHESLADTFAAVVDDDWTMGEDLFGDGRVTRSMERPADGYVPKSFTGDALPSHMSQYASGGSPHVNAGIPSHAAYLIGESLGRGELSRLYVSALRDHLHGALGFQSFAGATYRAAAGDHERQAVRDAWTAVGIDAAEMATRYP